MFDKNLVKQRFHHVRLKGVQPPQGNHSYHGNQQLSTVWFENRQKSCEYFFIVHMSEKGARLDNKLVRFERKE
jgi:hypothetical protein